MFQINGNHCAEQGKAELGSYVKLLHPTDDAGKWASSYSFRPSKHASQVTWAECGFGQNAGEPKFFELGGKLHGKEEVHAVLYGQLNIEAVFQHCSANSLALANLHQNEGFIILSGYELLQKLPGNGEHRQNLYLPVLASQAHPPDLAQEVEKFCRHNPKLQAMLVAGSGLYTWGDSPREAYAKVQILEFVFSCEIKLMQLAGG